MSLHPYGHFMFLMRSLPLFSINSECHKPYDKARFMAFPDADDL